MLSLLVCQGEWSLAESGVCRNGLASNPKASEVRFEEVKERADLRSDHAPLVQCSEPVGAAPAPRGRRMLS